MMDSQPTSQTETTCSCPPGCCSGNRWFKPAAIIIGVLIALGLFGNIYLVLRNQKSPLPCDSAEGGTLRGTPTQILVTLTPDPTAGWLIYQNTKYGYEFKYPSSWFLEKMPEQGIGGVDMISSYKILDMQTKDPNFWKGKLKIDIGKEYQAKKTGQSLEDWLKEYEKGPGVGMLTKTSQENTTVGGKKAIKIVSEFTDDKDMINITYFIENGDYIYFISGGNDFSVELKTIFDQILSAFKFLP